MSFFKQLPPEIEERRWSPAVGVLAGHAAARRARPHLDRRPELHFHWNEFTVALDLTSQSNATVPVVVAKFANDYEVQHSQMAAASILATLPALLLMLSGQRFIPQGLMQGRQVKAARAR